MDAGGIKEVKVMLKSDDEMAVLSGGKKPRRKRGTRKVGGAVAATEATPESGRVADAGGSLSPMAAAMAEGPAARIEKVGGSVEPIGVQTAVSGEGRGAPLIGGGVTSEPISPLATGLSITPSAEVKPVLSTTTTTGGGGAPVVIGGKRGASVGTVNTVGSGGAAKIIPTKRRPISAAPAARTFKKAKFVVGGGETPGAESAPPGGKHVSGSGVTGGAAGAAKQTRRFKERKIKFTVKSSRASKEIRRKVKARVRAMTLHDVRKILLAKGIIKVAAAEKLPEEMLRNMLRDYMLLHNAE